MAIEIIGVIISGLSALIAATAAIITFHQAKRGWYVSTISPQRFVWAENLRNALSAFFDAYYQQDQKRLCTARDNILLYLTPSNNKHEASSREIKRVINAEVDNLNSVIKEAQKLLRWNWWMVKAESDMNKEFEQYRDKLVESKAQ